VTGAEQQAALLVGEIDPVVALGMCTFDVLENIDATTGQPPVDVASDASGDRRIVEPRELSRP
jgi:hypothetical protein